MSFVSPEFALLCLLFFPIYWSLAAHTRLQRALLMLSGYALYASWSVGFALQLLIYSVSICVLADWVAREPKRRLPGVIALLLCTGCLILFKYADFLRTSVMALTASLGWPISWPDWDLVAPVGLSFLTFQAITYLVMVARDPRTRRPWPEVWLFLCFWPTLFAGPILRAERFFAQLDAGTPGRPRNSALALYWLVLGATQKLIFATWLSQTWVDPVFKTPDAYAGLHLAAAMLAYTLQIMLDFGGYTLIVTGLALLLGYELPVNFRQPYLARNLPEFWTRWHVSLSSFIRDYIYIPMGGNRRGFLRTQANVMFGMLVSGAWHGANWTFVVWGLLHGMGVVGVNIYKKAQGPVMPAWLAHGLTLLFVSVAWVFFRAENLTDACTVLHNMLTQGTDWARFPAQAMCQLAVLLAVFGLFSSQAHTLQTRLVNWLQTASLWRVGAVLTMSVYAIIAWGPSGVPGFIYYRF